MEWNVVLVIISLVGLGGAVVPPIVKLTKAITKLTVNVEGLHAQIDAINKDNRDSHKLLWEHNDEQDVRLNAHEIRIDRLEHNKL